MAPTNLIHLDHYYNSLKEANQNDYHDSMKDMNRRIFPIPPEEPKTFGQSLKELFFPDEKSNRRIIKIRKPQMGSVPTTMKPLFTTLSTLEDKLSFTKYVDIDKMSSESFPYVFQRPIEDPSSR